MMKVTLKRTLLFSLLILTFVCLLAVSTSAATYADDNAAITVGMTVRIGDEGGDYYATLTDAVDAASAGDTVTVIAAHTTGAVTIDKNLTVNGQGLKVTQSAGLTVSAGTVVLENLNLHNVTSGNSLTVKGGANITVSGDNTRIENSVGYVIANSGATLTVKAGYFLQSGTNRVFWQNSSASAVTTIEGGTFTNTETNTNRMIGLKLGTLNVTGGTFICNGTYNLFFMENADSVLNVSGGEFTLANTASEGKTIFEVRGATNKLFVSGGNFTVNGAKNSLGRMVVASVEITGGTFTSAGAGFIFSKNSDGTPASPVASISNATITANGGNAIEVASDYLTTLSSLTISNCSLSASGAALAINKPTTAVEITDSVIDATGDAIVTTVTTAITVSGGSITSDASAFNIAGGAGVHTVGTTITAAASDVIANDSTVTIITPNPYANDAAALAAGKIVRIGDEGALATRYYPSIYAAIEDAIAGETLVLLAPITLNEVLSLPFSLTIDGQGYAINTAVNYAFTLSESQSLTLHNCDITFTGTYSLIKLAAGSTLNISGEKARLDASKMTATGARVITGSTDAAINISDGVFLLTTTSDSRIIWCGGSTSTTVTVSGGKFYGGVDPETMQAIPGNARCLIGASGTSHIIIEGGEFYVTGLFDNPAGAGHNAIFAEGSALVTIREGSSSQTPVIKRIGGDAGNGYPLIDLNNSGKTVISAGEFVSSNVVLRARNKNQTVTVSGGTFTSSHSNAIIVTAAGTLNISGGTLTALSSDSAAILVSGAAKLNLSGGNIYSTASGISVTGAATVTVTGGDIHCPVDRVTLSNTSATLGAGSSTAPYVTDTVAWCATGAVARIGANGSNNVAYYTSLAKAIAEATDGQTIFLIANTSLSEAVTVNANVTIDGNGYTLSCALSNAITVGASKSLTLNDFCLTFTGNTKFLILSSGSSLSITGEKTRLDASGVTTECYFIVGSTNATVNISGGTFIAATTNDSRFFWSGGGTSTTLTVTGGKFYMGVDPETMAATTNSARCIFGASGTSHVILEGGDFYSAGRNIIFIEGTAAITVRAAADGSAPQFIKLGTYDSPLLDSNSAGNVTISAGAFTAPFITLNFRNANQTVAISGGSFTSTGAHALNTSAVATITISGGTFTGEDASALKFASSGTFVITGGTIVGENAPAVTLSGTGTLTIENGTFTGETTNAINVSAVGTLNLNGGSIVSAKNAIHYTDAASGATLNLNGGTIQATENGVVMVLAQGTLNIGETQVHAEIDPFVVSQTLTIVSTKETPTCDIEAIAKGGYFARIGEWGKDIVFYDDWASFVNALNKATGTVSAGLLSNCTITATSFTGSANVIISGNSRTITATAGSAFLFKVSAGNWTLTNANITLTEGAGFLTMTGNATFNSNVNVDTVGDAFKMATSRATLNVNGGDITADGYGVSFASSSKNTVVNFYGGSLTTAKRTLLQNVKSTINVYGGTFANLGTAVDADGNEDGLERRTVWLNGGDKSNTLLNIYGGRFISCDTNNALIGGSTGTVTIEGGYFEGNNTRLFFLEGTDLIIKEGANGEIPEFRLNAESPTATQIFDVSGSKTITLKISAGVFNSDSYILRCRNSSAATTVTIEDGVFNSTYGVSLYSGSGTVNLNGGTMRVDRQLVYTNNTDLTAITLNIDGIDAAHKAQTAENLIQISKAGVTTNIRSGKLVSLTNADGNSSLMRFLGTVNIYGGTMISRGNCEITIYPAPGNTVLNVYGGYIEGGGKYMIRPAGNSTAATVMNIYGGHFVQTNTTGNNGAIVRVGTGTNPATLNVYGGYFETKGSFNSIFWAANEPSATTATLVNLYSYTCSGGKAICIYDGNDHGAGDLYYETADKTASMNIISVNTGASVRLVSGSTGIRFTSTISAGFLDMIESLGATNVSYGTIIVPTDYLAGLKSFSLETITAKGKPHLDIPAVNGIIENDDGSITIRAAMVNLREVNYGRRFSAVVYAKYTVGGREYTYFSGYDKVDNSRSMSYIAKEAQTMVSDTFDEEVYKYEITDVNGNNVYSPFAQFQYNMLADYITALTSSEVDIYLIAGQNNASGDTVFTQSFKEKFPAEYSNILYAGAGASDTGYELFDLDNLTVGMGSDYNLIGPELGIADILSEYYNEKTGKTAVIIKWADGDTNLLDVITDGNARIGNWYPPSYIEAYGCQDETLSGAQYRKLVEIFRNTFADLKAMGYTEFNLNGLFWMQGESDMTLTSLVFNGTTVTLDETVAGTASSPLLGTTETYSYPNVFKAFVADLRADLGEIIGDTAEAKAMPIIIGELSSTLGRAQSERNTSFIAMQRTLATKIGNCCTIDTSALSISTDNYLFSAQDMLTVGHLVGQKLFDLNFENFEVEGPAKVAAVYASNGTLIDYYGSLAYAINSAPKGATVKLLGDVVFDLSPLNISNPNGVTIDGQGHSFISDYSRAINFIGCDVTFQNINVIHRVSGTSNYMAYFYDSAAVTINNGTYNAGYWGFVVNASGCSLTINDGTFTVSAASTKNYSPVKVGSNSTVTINGGTFTAADNGTCVSVDHKYATVTLNGGTYNATETYAIWNNNALYPQVLILDVDKLTFTGATYLANSYSTVYTESVTVALESAREDAGYTGEYTDAQRTAVETVLKKHTWKTATTAKTQQFLLGGTGPLTVTFDKTYTSTSGTEYTSFNYTVMQGGCASADGKYYYVCLWADNDLPTIIGTFDLSGSDAKLIGYTNVGVRGHANDLTYVPGKNGAADRIVMAQNATTGYNNNMISIFTVNSNKTLTFVEQKALTNTFTGGALNIWGISYNAKKDQYVVGMSGHRTFAILDSEFNVIKICTNVQTLFTTQGMTSDDNYIYFPRHVSDHGLVMVYDWDGEFVGYIACPAFSANYEIENCAVINGKLCIAIIDRKSSATATTSRIKLCTLTLK